MKALGYHLKLDIMYPKTFDIERTTIFIFYFCIGLVTQLNNSSFGISKDHFITIGIDKLLIGNSRFLNQNLLNQLLCCTDI